MRGRPRPRGRGEEGKATLVARDDGRGIAGMAKLVTCGSSGWDERTDLAENAAGMGVFPLASRGAPCARAAAG